MEHFGRKRQTTHKAIHGAKVNRTIRAISNSFKAFNNAQIAVDLNLSGVDLTFQNLKATPESLLILRLVVWVVLCHERELGFECFYSAASTRFFFPRPGALRAKTGAKNCPV
jgi:hypothetical protein